MKSRLTSVVAVSEILETAVKVPRTSTVADWLIVEVILLPTEGSTAIDVPSDCSSSDLADKLIVLAVTTDPLSIEIDVSDPPSVLVPELAKDVSFE